MKRSHITLFVIFLIPLACFAQDPSFSQFYASRTYLNPAFTGVEPGIGVAGVYRMQWAQVDGGFRTYGISAEIREPFLQSGFGINILQDREGLAELTTTSIGLSYAYTIPMEQQNIHIGLNARWVQKSVDWSKIVFSDQLDPVYGNIYSTTAIPIVDKVSFTDFDMGVLWRFKTDLKLGKRLFKNTHNSIGISLNHAPALFNETGGYESLQNLNTRAAPRLTLHAGSILPAFILQGRGKHISISPNFKYDLQGEKLGKLKENLQVFTYGLYVLYEGVYIGAFYQNKLPVAGLRHTNAFIMVAGAYVSSARKSRKDKQKFFIGFSYDANTTGVGTRAGGVFELAFRMNFAEAPTFFGSGRGTSSKRVLDCFNFF